MENDYLLNRDAAESKRLGEQHELWIKSLDYIINPQVAATLPTTAQVADIGTGTGIWPMAAAKAKPNYKITGFDISADQFPEASQRPANVILRVHDLRQPFPSDLHGRFDLVHARLLLAALADQDAWNATVNNVMALLKPGGWLQFEEADFTSMARPMRSGSAGSQSITALRRGFQKQITITDQRTIDVPEKVLAAFHQAGLAGVEIDMVSSDRLGDEGRYMGTSSQIRVVDGLMKQWRTDRGQVAPLEKTPQEDEAVIQAMKEELEKGAYVIYFIFCVMGRKQA